MKYQTRSTPIIIVVSIIAAMLLFACENASLVVPEDQEELAPNHAHSSRVLSPAEQGKINRQLSALRRATAPFHNFDKALEAGYDVELTSCWYHSDLGAMGYHYANPDFIENASVNLLEPEAIMYEPGPAGQMRMVGFEYIVPIDETNESDPPSLLGQEYHRSDGMGIYFLHLWLWRNNPDGLFANWNPKVSCEHAEEPEDFGAR